MDQLGELVGESPRMVALRKQVRTLADILARGEGNPFFLEELARVASGPDARPDRGVPVSVQDVLAARIEALADADRHVLQVAAVLGRDAPVVLVQEAADLSMEDVEATLRRLQAGEFLYATELGPSAAYDEAFQQSEETGERAFVSDLSRLKGEAFERQALPDEAARCFRVAVDVAREQGAWLFALRAAARLSDLDPQSVDTLRVVVDHFPPGVESSDLITARKRLGGPHDDLELERL